MGAGNPAIALHVLDGLVAKQHQHHQLAGRELGHAFGKGEDVSLQLSARQ
jgi:hypothetical protein